MPDHAAVIHGFAGERFAAAKAAKASGVKVVGTVGAAVPRELILAAGCFPVALMARPEDHNLSSAPMEEAHEAEIRSLFRQAIAGDFAFCDLMIVASTSDGYRFLFQYLNEMIRSGRGANLPPIMLFDFLFGPSSAIRDYNRLMLGRLSQRLESLAGKTVGVSQLVAVIARTNKVRRAVADVNAARQRGLVSGCDAAAALASGLFLEPEAELEILQSVVESSRSAAKIGGPRLVVATAVPLYHYALHATLAAVGAVVTAEDDEYARRGGPVIAAGNDPIAAIAEHYRLHSASPRQHTAIREQWFVDSLSRGCDGVVFYVPPEDNYFGWSYPSLARRAEGVNIKTLLLREDILDPAGKVRSAELARAFVAQLEGGPA